MEALTYPDDAGKGVLDVFLDISVGGALIRTEQAQVRIAPWLVFNHANLTEKVYMVAVTDNQGLRNQISDVLTRLAHLPALQVAQGVNYSNDIWMQDGLEPGFAAIPRAAGVSAATPATLRTARDRTPTDDAGNRLGPGIDTFPRRELLQPDFGFHQAITPTPGLDSLDSFGNLECSPPFTHSGPPAAGGGKAYPFGRIVYGGPTKPHGVPRRMMHPDVVTMLGHQVVQAPVEIDSDWLVVGHVDEFISFLPSAGGTHGWKVMIASPALAMRIVSAQPPRTPLFQGIDMTQVNTFDDHTPQRALSHFYQRRTCGSITARGSPFPAWQITVQRIINEVIRTELKPALHLQDSDFIHIPILYEKMNGRFIAYTPGSVNMLVVSRGGNDTHLCVPKPFGPVVGGQCKFEEDIRSKLTAHVASISFFDDFTTYHIGMGEIHCGSNSQRTPPPEPWWDTPWI